VEPYNVGMSRDRQHITFCYSVLNKVLAYYFLLLQDLHCIKLIHPLNQIDLAEAPSTDEPYRLERVRTNS